MTKPREFPEVTYGNTGQTAQGIDGWISLRNPAQGAVDRASRICETLCPHFTGEGGKIECSGIGSAGNAHIRVERSARREKWLRFRVARLFNAPCKVTYDAILKKRRA